MNKVYTEKAPQMGWVTLLLTGSLFLVLYVFVLSFQEGDPAAYILLPVLALVTWAVFAFQNMRYELTQKSLVAWFWPFRIIVPFAQIKKVSVERYPWWMGVGLRFWFDRVAYSSRWGKAVRIEKRRGIRELWITPANPEDFAQLVRQRMRKANKRNRTS